MCQFVHLFKILAKLFIAVVNRVSQIRHFLKHVAYLIEVYVAQDESW